MKRTLSLILVICMTLSLVGCKEKKTPYQDEFAAGQNLEIKVNGSGTVEKVAEGVEIEVQSIDKSSTFISNGFRAGFDRLLNINNISIAGSNSKQGCLYVRKDENGSEYQYGDATIRDAFRNKTFLKYWEDTKFQNEFVKLAEDAYKDVSYSSLEAKYAVLNAYYNLIVAGNSQEKYLKDAVLTREQFYAAVYKSKFGINELQDYESFEESVGYSSEYTPYVAQLANDGWVTLESGELTQEYLVGVISKFEAVYLIVNVYFPDYIDNNLSKIDEKSSYYGYKNSGDLETVLNLGAYSVKKSSNTLAYMLAHSNEGIDQRMLTALSAASKLNILNGISSDLTYFISKNDAVKLIVNTILGENKAYPDTMTSTEYADVPEVEDATEPSEVPDSTETLENIKTELTNRFKEYFNVDEANTSEFNEFIENIISKGVEVVESFDVIVNESTGNYVFTINSGSEYSYELEVDDDFGIVNFVEIVACNDSEE